MGRRLVNLANVTAHGHSCLYCSTQQLKVLVSISLSRGGHQAGKTSYSNCAALHLPHDSQFLMYCKLCFLELHTLHICTVILNTGKQRRKLTSDLRDSVWGYKLLRAERNMAFQMPWVFKHIPLRGGEWGLSWVFSFEGVWLQHGWTSNEKTNQRGTAWLF